MENGVRQWMVLVEAAKLLEADIPPTGKGQMPIKDGVITIKHRIVQNPWPGKIRLTAILGRQQVGNLVYGMAGQSIDDMYVDPQFRRQGINTAMHKYLEKLLGEIDPNHSLRISQSLSLDGANFYNVHPKFSSGKHWTSGRA